MAFTKKVARITIHGTSFNGNEEWTTGFYMGTTGVDATQPTQAFMDIVKSSWQTFFTNATSYFGTAWKTDYVKGVLLGTDGKTIADSAMYSYYTTAIAGVQAGAMFPPQCALVATLTSGAPRGLASKGRMYLPGINATLDNTGHISSTNTGTIATNLKTFLNALNGTVEQPGVVILASQGRKAPLVGPPVNAVVTGIRVGNVYDTQRRRRNQLLETYSGVTL